MWHLTGSQEGKWKSESEVAHWDPTDCSLPGSPVHEIFQARVLECVTHGILPTQGLNLGFPHCKQMLYPPSPQNPSEFSLREEVVMWNTPLSSAPYQCLVISGAQGLLPPAYRSSLHVNLGTWTHQSSAQESSQWGELREGHVQLKSPHSLCLWPSFLSFL